MAEPEDERSLPVISKMPIVVADVWHDVRDEIRRGGEQYYWSLGANFTRANPEFREAYEAALREKPSETPNATGATVLLVLRILDIQVKREGYQLPLIPNPIDPMPALREFVPRGDGSEFTLIDLAYREIIRTNPVIKDIVEYMGVGAPDELLRIMSETQAKRGAVYAFYAIKSVLPK